MNRPAVYSLGVMLAVGGAALVLRAEGPGTDAAKELAGQLNALKDTETLHAKFVCEKRLSMLETPLVSQGELWIKKGDPKDGDGAVRFSTEKPYVSELILAKGKVIVRSQHESEWTKTNQSGRPGLTAVMAQLGSWSTGEAGKVAEQYSVAVSSEGVPPLPKVKGEDGVPATQGASEAAVFTLTPTNKDLLKAVKRVTIAIDRKTHLLLSIEILTQQDDATRYWFYDVRENPELPAETFAPTSGAGGGNSGGKPGERP